MGKEQTETTKLSPHRSFNKSPIPDPQSAINKPPPIDIHYQVQMSLWLAIGIVLAMIEALYMPPLPIPGAKVGIASLVSLLLITFYGPRAALANVALRTTLVALITGTFATPAFIFSIMAGLLSVAVMLVCRRLFKSWLSLVGISVFGAVAHNLVQLGLAIPLLATWKVVVHLPLLLFVGTLTGVFNGWIAQTFVSRKDILAAMGIVKRS